MSTQTIEATSAAPSSRCVDCSAEAPGECCADCGAAQAPGGYRAVAVLSRGAHGRSYLVEDAAGAKLTLKELVFSKAADAQQIESFERESSILRSLSNARIPRFVRSFHVGQGASARMYIAHQYVPGESLAHELETRRFTEDQVFPIARHLFELLQYLHGLSPQVLHQDIKAANVVHTSSNETFLVGFGSAREAHGPLVDQAAPASCLAHLAPEQLSGRSTDASDLYGVGMVMLQLLSRRSPEQLRATPGGIQAAIETINVSHPTARFIAQLLAENPSDRPASATEALRQLTAISGRAARVSAGRKAIRRPGFRRGVAVAGLLALGAFAGRLLMPSEVVHVVEAPRVSSTQRAASSHSAIAPMRSWGPEQLLGAPNTPRPGDISTAWASKTQDGRAEWIEVGYSQPVAATKLKIYETYNPGSISKVVARFVGGQTEVLWEGNAAPTGGLRVFEVASSPARKIASIRVELDSRAVPGWNEIDAVGLEDASGTMHWATSASASTTYAE